MLECSEYEGRVWGWIGWDNDKQDERRHLPQCRCKRYHCRRAQDVERGERLQCTHGHTSTSCGGSWASRAEQIQRLTSIVVVIR